MAGDMTLMQALTTKMDWLEGRQKVIAQNIANADTPGYRAQDLEKPDFKGLLKSSTSRVSLAATDGSHLTSGGALAGQANLKEKQSKQVYEVSPDGNAVVLEEQLLKMGETMTDHRLVTTLYQKNIDMLKMVTRPQ